MTTLPRDRGPHDVDDTHDLAALDLNLSQRAEGVCRLTGLTDNKVGDRGSITGLQCLNSLATSAVAGTRASCSMAIAPTRQA